MKVKTKVIILVSVCFVVLIAAIFGDKILSRSYLVEVKSSEVIEMMKNKEDFVLLISQTTCNHCASYKPKLEDIANEYKIKMYYIQVDLLNADESKEFSSYLNYSSTPVTVFIKNGEEKTAATRIVGNQSINTIKMKLKANGWIEK